MAAAALVVGACRGPATTPSRLVERFIAEDPQRLLDPAEWRAAVEVVSWDFTDPAERRRWKTIGAPLLAASEEGGRQGDEGDAAGERRKTRLVREVRLESGEIDAFELALASASPVTVHLLWATGGEPFSAEHRQTAQIRRRGGDTVRFDLTADPGWNGTAVRLRLDVVASADAAVDLRSLRAVRFELPKDRMPELVGDAWKVSLGAETRNALVAVPGLPAERQLEVPEGGRLRFAYGAASHLGKPTRLSVHVQAEGGDVEEVFAVELAPGAPSLGRWTTAEADLSLCVGQSCRVALVAETAERPNALGDLAFWAHPEVVAPGEREGPPNVVVISVDTLRADHMSLYGYERATTPHLERWAAEGAIVFENAVAAAPWTLPSHTSLFTGLDATTHGVNSNHPAPPELEMMAEILRRAGYTTRALTGGGWVGPDLGLMQGFDVSSYRRRDPLADRELVGNVAAAIEWLTSAPPEPFFLFFHTFETHSPHVPRQPFFERFSGRPPDHPLWVGEESRPMDAEHRFLAYKDFYRFAGKGAEPVPLRDTDHALVTDLYDSGVAYMDQQLARLLEHLEAQGLDERTVVVLTSDHGEALGERGLASHGYLGDFNLMVPLVVAAPGLAAGRVETQVRSVDVLPTLLEMLDLPATAGDGVSLLPVLRGEAEVPPAWSYASSSNRGIAVRIGNRLKYVYNDTAWDVAHGEEALYDLRRDPAETTDLAARDDATVARLRELVGERIAGLSPAVRIELTNRGESELVGVLASPALGTAKVKAFGLPSRAISPLDGRRLRFRVPPGERLGLYVTNPDAGALRFELGDGATPSVHEVEVATAGATTHLVRRDGRWSEVAGDPPATATATISVTRRGFESSLRAADPTSSNRALREQLEALGYL